MWPVPDQEAFERQPGRESRRSERGLRQALAYVVVIAAGLASLGTSDCDGIVEATARPSTVELGPAGSEVMLHYRVRTDLELENLALYLHYDAGEGEVQVVVPSPLLGKRGSDEAIPADGVATTLSLADFGAGQSVTVCHGVCDREVDVLITRISGTDTATLTVGLTVDTIDYGCGNPQEYHLIVDRTE